SKASVLYVLARDGGRTLERPQGANGQARSRYLVRARSACTDIAPLACTIINKDQVRRARKPSRATRSRAAHRSASWRVAQSAAGTRSTRTPSWLRPFVRA